MSNEEQRPAESANVSCVCCFGLHAHLMVAVIVADRRMRQPLAAVTSPLVAPCYCHARPVPPHGSHTAPCLCLAASGLT